jgi:hypothetical protein
MKFIPLQPHHIARLEVSIPNFIPVLDFGLTSLEIALGSPLFFAKSAVEPLIFY